MIRILRKTRLVLAASAAVTFSLALIAGAAGAATADSTPTDAAKLQPLVLYGTDGNVDPYFLFLGTPSNWAFKIGKSGQSSLNAGNIKAEPAKVGELNGMKITWTGGIGQVYSQSKVSSDKFDYLEADGALVFDAIVHQPPQEQVIMRIDCGYPCQGLVDLTDYYKNAPIDKKLVVKIPLACFEKTGAKFGGINTPWLIYTTNTFSMSVANVRYVAGAAKDSDVATKCGA